MALFKKPAIPDKLGRIIDLLYKTRQKRLDENRRVEAMKGFEGELKDYLINILPKSEASGVAGKLARAQVTSKRVPVVQDWDAFFQHVAKTKSWDLLVRRVNDSAVVERWEAGKDVPGVGSFTVTNVSVTKL